MIAKRLDCPYTPGRRTSGWVKVKNICTTDVVIGGWLAGEGGRSGPARRARDRRSRTSDGVLRYAGRVGTGFTEAELTRLGGLLDVAGHRREPVRRPPAAEADPVRGARLVARVEFNERTQAGTLRQPSYKGLRDDVDAADVRFG